MPISSVRRKYRDEGYSFASAQVSFDPASGVVTIDVNEGTIDGVEFQGVDEKLARRENSRRMGQDGAEICESDAEGLQTGAG